MNCAGDQSKSEALRKRAAMLLHLAEDARDLQSESLRLHRVQQSSKACCSDAANQVPEGKPAAPCFAAAAAASCAATADGVAETKQGGGRSAGQIAGSGGQEGQEITQLGIGEVVWAREKGWPHWPALLITKETSRGLCNIREPVPLLHYPLWTILKIAVGPVASRIEVRCFRYAYLLLSSTTE